MSSSFIVLTYRFNQQDYVKYVRMENVLIGGFNRKEVESDLEFIGRQFEGAIVWTGYKRS